MQIGGSDQWGNILSGTELIFKAAQRKAFGLTTELLLNEKGEKFGKSEVG